MRLTEGFIAESEGNANPISQQAVVYPLRRFNASSFASDPSLETMRLEALAINLAMASQEWLNTLFHSDAEFYPGVLPDDEMCADLAAFLAWRLGNRAKRFGGAPFSEI